MPEDEMRNEYDLKSLSVRRMGPKIAQFASHVVALDPDVASAFPDAASVNDALRFLLKLTAENPITVKKAS